MVLVDIYADEGITGTELEKRDEMKRLIRDCKHKKIDRVLVKSVTRFARNSLECIQSWKEEIKENPNALFTAITDADKIAKYVSGKEQEYRQTKDIQFYAIVEETNAYSEQVYKCCICDEEGRVKPLINYGFADRDALEKELDKRVKGVEKTEEKWYNKNNLTIEGKIVWKIKLRFLRITQEILYSFVDRIEIGEKEKFSHNTQKIKIIYNFIGAVDIPQE